MKLTIKPNVQREKWSLYWWESMATMTEALEAFVLEVSKCVPGECHDDFP